MILTNLRKLDCGSYISSSSEKLGGIIADKGGVSSSFSFFKDINL